MRLTRFISVVFVCFLFLIFGFSFLGVGNVGATVYKCPSVQEGISLENPLCNYSPILLMDSQKTPLIADSLIGITYFTASSEPIPYELTIIRIAGYEAQDATYYKSIGGLKALKLPSYITMANMNTPMNTHFSLARSNLRMLARSMI